jgi:hypothetical protein
MANITYLKLHYHSISYFLLMFCVDFFNKVHHLNRNLSEYPNKKDET